MNDMSSPLVRPDAALLDHLKSLAGAGGWLAPEDAARFFVDPRNRFSGGASLVLRPTTTDQVAAIIAACAAARVGVTPFGAGTGAVAGHLDIADQGVVVLSLDRMRRIRSVDADSDVIIAEAGCVLDDIHAAAEAAGRRFGLSLASSGSCTIGGNLATNAGGVRTLRYGNMRDLCLGVEAVMADGRVFRGAQALRKDNTGYDLSHLMIGSEGTLGVITAAALKLAPRPEESVTLMAAVADPAAALALLHALRGRMGEVVSAFELMSRLGVSLATRHFPEERDPFGQPHQWYALVDLEGRGGLQNDMEAVMAEVMAEDLIIDAVVASSTAQARSLWLLRELAHDYNQMEGAFCSSDTSVPLSRIGSFVAKATSEIARLDPDIRANCYGHIGDGNIHVNLFAPEGVSKQAFLAANPTVNDDARMIINEVTHAEGGSISAEHGIGRLKTEDLRRYADPTKLSMITAIKNALDPLGIMNPGAVFRQAP